MLCPRETLEQGARELTLIEGGREMRLRDPPPGAVHERLAPPPAPAPQGAPVDAEQRVELGHACGAQRLHARQHDERPEIHPPAKESDRGWREALAAAGAAQTQPTAVSGIVHRRRYPARLTRVGRAVEAPPALRATGALRPLGQLAIDRQQVVIQSWVCEQLIAHLQSSPVPRDSIVAFEALMPKIGRNQPCPCGSGKKYKRCCWNTDQVARAEAARHTEPARTPETISLGDEFFLGEDDLDRLSNRVVALIDEGRLEEAEVACQELKAEYPEVIDWIHRTAMLHEARGEHRQAIEYYERTLQYMDAYPEDFEERSREPFREAIARLRSQ